MEHSLHGSPFLSGTHSRSGLLEDGHVFFPFLLPGESVQTCHGCVPVKVDGCFDDHEQTGAENVNFHLKDTNFMAKLLPGCVFSDIQLLTPVNPVDQESGNIA